MIFSLNGSACVKRLVPDQKLQRWLSKSACNTGIPGSHPTRGYVYTERNLS
jgi:hypothetical protein